MSDEGELDRWLDRVRSRGHPWFAKRLSANDTTATGGHQFGFHLPNALAFRLFPELREGVNPRVSLRLSIASHGHIAPDARLTYYNQLTRNECRITRLGGRKSQILDPDNTGALVIVAFDPGACEAEAWVTRSVREEEGIEAEIGEVEPGLARWAIPDAAGLLRLFEDQPVGRCAGGPGSLPPAWMDRFPAPRQLAEEAIRRIPARSGDLDALLISRHRCEYSLFRATEAVHAGSGVQQGFESVAAFLSTAQSVLQRRKSRAGTSLELQVAALLSSAHVTYERGVVIEGSHRPDFLFPSASRYADAPPASRDLHILAVKSTLRDRWRQVLHEADKVPVKHLLTLDEGVSAAHIREMTDQGIRLVIPRPLMRSYPKTTRSALMTFGTFVDLVAGT